MYSDRAGRWWFLPASVGLTAAAVSLAGTAPNLLVLGLLIVAGGIGSAIMHPEAGKYAAMVSAGRRAGGISIFQVGGAIGYALGPYAIARITASEGTQGSLWMAIPGALAVGALFLTMARVDRAAQRMHAPAKATAGSAARADSVGVALLVVSTALRYLVSAAFMTFLPNLLVSRGASTLQAGEIVTAFLAVGAIGLFAGGYLSDRFGALRVSIASFVLAVPLLLSFFTFGGALGILCLLCASAMLNVQAAPSVAIVQQMLPKNLGMALGLMNGVAFGIGSALVAVVGLIIVQGGPAAALRGVSVLPLLCAAVYLYVGRTLRGV